MSFEDPFDDVFDDDPMGNIDTMLDKVPSDFRSGFPEIDLHHQGQKTVIRNYSSIIKKINRAPEHLKKYLSSNLGVKTKVRNSQLEISSQLSRRQITAITEKYAKEYIICPNCGKPDTVLTMGKKQEMRCLACGTTTQL